jgi:hypothetical protein
MLAATPLEEVVDVLLADGRSFNEIEDFINELPISEEDKSVLWLWAWAEQPRRTRRLMMPARVRLTAVQPC